MRPKQNRRGKRQFPYHWNQNDLRFLEKTASSAYRVGLRERVCACVHVCVYLCLFVCACTCVCAWSHDWLAHTQPITNKNSGSLLSLLGQNRCEKKEGAQHRGREEEKGVYISHSRKYLRVPVTDFHSSLWVLLLFLCKVFVALNHFSTSCLYHHFPVFF